MEIIVPCKVKEKPVRIVNSSEIPPGLGLTSLVFSFVKNASRDYHKRVWGSSDTHKSTITYSLHTIVCLSKRRN